MILEGRSGFCVATDETERQASVWSVHESAADWRPPQDYPSQTEIIRQDSPAETVYLVESGLLKLSRIDRSGHEVISGICCSNWIADASAVLLGKPYSFTITTLSSCRLRSISAEGFLGLVEKDRAFSRRMLTLLSHEIFTQRKNIASFTRLSAIDRLKQLLYDIIMETEQAATLKDQVRISIPLKHKEMAQMIAVTPEHFCRLMKTLEQERIIIRDNGQLIVRDIQSLACNNFLAR